MTPSPESQDPIYENECALEQSKISEFYSRLDQYRDHVDERLQQAQASTPTGTPSSIAERDALISSLAERRKSLLGVDQRLCFGRLDTESGQTHYIGRLGLSDDDQNPVLIDWRAQVSAPFYSATAVTPLGVVRRRHIATTDRTVTSLDDDVLDLDALERLGLTNIVGHDSLLTSLDEARTGQMRDIVATIQAEQDRIIRAPLSGTLVVQGGPGTGKTVVALHRIAYLLYQHRDTIARQGALVVGPNRRFLDYIDQVLPALGETGVTLTTIDQLVENISPNHDDPPEVAKIKGSLNMARVMKSLVESRQRIPRSPIPLNINGTVITLDPEDVMHAARRARDTHKPHNEARNIFAKDLLNRLARKLAQALNLELDEPTRQDLVADLREVKDVRREINLCWMPQDAATLLKRFLSDPELMASTAPELTYDEQRLLLQAPRPDNDSSDEYAIEQNTWSTSDVPLLDELEELLGVFDPAGEQRRTTGPSQDELEMARRSIEASGPLGGMVTADSLISRYGATDNADHLLEPHQRRGWVFGHIVVDEAQELSPMQWRMIYRRVPSKSVTVVGDPAQTSSAAGAGSWAAALEPFVGDRWTLERLTVNYRTPTKIMEVANQVLDVYEIPHDPGTTVREGHWPVEKVQCAAITSESVAEQITKISELVDHGTLAVITHNDLIDITQAAVAQYGSDPENANNLRLEVNTMTPRESKGLEFDAVLLVEPRLIAANDVRPGQDLYVAMSRPTQLLRVLYSDALPADWYSSLPDVR